MKILKKEMRELGMTSKALAKKVGVSEATITHWINGKFLPSMDNMTKLRKLGFSQRARVAPSIEE